MPDPRPLPAAWLRVWRSVGLDVSGLEATPEPAAEQREEPPEERAEGEAMKRTTPVLHLHSRIPVLFSLVIRPIAVTLGRHIFVRRGVTPTDVLLRHEAAHVAQFLELGMLRFLWYYLTDWLKAWWRLRDGAAAYRAIRFEQEARFLERFNMPWAEVATVRPPRPQSWESFTLPPRP